MRPVPLLQPRGGRAHDRRRGRLQRAYAAGKNLRHILCREHATGDDVCSCGFRVTRVSELYESRTNIEHMHERYARKRARMQTLVARSKPPARFRHPLIAARRSSP